MESARTAITYGLDEAMPRMPFPDRSIDAIFVCRFRGNPYGPDMGSQYLSRKGWALEIHRVLRPGGVFIHDVNAKDMKPTLPARFGFSLEFAHQLCMSVNKFLAVEAKCPKGLCPAGPHDMSPKTRGFWGFHVNELLDGHC